MTQFSRHCLCLIVTVSHFAVKWRESIYSNMVNWVSRILGITQQWLKFRLTCFALLHCMLTNYLIYTWECVNSPHLIQWWRIILITENTFRALIYLAFSTQIFSIRDTDIGFSRPYFHYILWAYPISSKFASIRNQIMS